MEAITELARSAQGSLPGAFMVFFALAIGHAVADFPLQGTFLARGKNRHVRMPDPEGDPFPPNLWMYCLTAHSLIQAGPVWLITGSFTFAFVEFALHWLIDYSKCEGWSNFAGDQTAHLVCKLAFALLLYAGFTPP